MPVSLKIRHITPSSETASKPQPNETVEAKPGLKLQKSQERWNETNVYFHSIFSLPAQINNLDDFIQDVQQKYMIKPTLPIHTCMIQLTFRTLNSKINT